MGGKAAAAPKQLDFSGQSIRFQMAEGHLMPVVCGGKLSKVAQQPAEFPCAGLSYEMRLHLSDAFKQGSLQLVTGEAPAAEPAKKKEE
jgi:hypothetical protein